MANTDTMKLRTSFKILASDQHQFATDSINTSSRKKVYEN